ncbi:hypothetical protein [Methylotenera mobilis]|uniref:hypothetical protein n=1 Tax=Methylotenera mobilis TaxID=359408 RepID=UPI00037924CE|nr:hypothetical protein [Methylotenera mobilis]PPC97726.1 MAG: hypothetical protein CTY32_00575 [Methylotenera sp.]
MHIQIKSRQSQSDFINETILTTQELWLKVNPDKSDDVLLLTFGDEIDPNANLHIEVIDANQVKIGFFTVEDDNARATILTRSDMHWLTISESTSDKTTMLTKFLTFLLGVIRTPSQMGTHMMDLMDLKKAMLFGTEANYVSLDDANAFYPANSKWTLSSIMLLNTELPISKKLSLVADFISQDGGEEHHLNILNITDNPYLPRTNIALFIVNIEAKTIH